MVHYTTGALIALCFICCVVVTGVNAGTGYKGLYQHDDDDYEIVVPRKVTEDGDFVSHLIPHSFQRGNYRSQRKVQLGDRVHYIIPYSGVDHHVELQPNYKFLSPGMVVERQYNRRLSVRDIHSPNDTLCHYTGRVRGHGNSKVALSTCNGLSGYVRAKRNYFLIQPSRGHDPFSGKQHPHVVHKYRKMDEGVNCGVTGNIIAKVSAKRWRKEAHRKKNTEKTLDRRSKQSVDNKCGEIELHVETLLVLDHSMLTYHKDIDLENYILTVFNMAHDLYHDISLGTNINLAIVRLIRLEDEDHEMNMAINKDAVKTLEYFREWQNWINPAEDTHPNHHDVAVLITRVDICENDNNCGVLGASKFGGMCDPHNQAALCEDIGLRLGFIIAHEIAHTLAILHDTPDESGCNATVQGNLTTVMSPTISIHTSEWSRCSKQILQLFMDSGFGKCLYDPPTEHSFVLPVDVLPGVMYDGNYQCREMFGPNSALCMTGVDCGNLICYIEDKGCVETHQAIAPGTTCGDKKWCYDGECIQIGERTASIDGNWGPWSQWSQCSRTCGSGVATQTRHCDNPAPAHGGKYCYGEHIRFKICSTEPCDTNQPSFRDVQCAEFNSWVYPEDNKVHQWKSYTLHDENPCVLFCINDWGDIASLRPRVIDGTTCYQGIRGICINGLCREIPCDLNLESNAVEDVCGVCRGDGTSCKLVQGEVGVTCCGHIEEEEILLIPEKAVNVKIEEMVPTESRIQIRSKDGETVFVIGNVLGTFNVPGSTAWVGNVRVKQEAITIDGPLSDSISIWVVVMENVTVRYAFGVPDSKNRVPQFSWDFLSWSRCSAECGPGTQEAIPACIEKLAGMVDDMYCANLTKPRQQMRTCEIAPCVNRWFIGDWLPCDHCPKGVRQRVVKCVKPTGGGEGEVIFVGDGECTGPKPKSKESCTCVAASSAKTSTSRKRFARPENERKTTSSTPKSAGTSGSVTINVTIWDDTENSTLWPTVIPPPSSTNGSELCAKIAALLGKTVLDKDDPRDIVLTIHTELEEGKRPAGVPAPECDDNEEPTYTLRGKEALKFINTMEKDFENNKTKI